MVFIIIVIIGKFNFIPTLQLCEFGSQFIELSYGAIGPNTSFSLAEYSFMFTKTDNSQVCKYS